ncbi:MAG TPA: hypothetical protein VMV47_09510 [Bacteroidales bacterium]|nr:hypothetical protein [Bacteroidales bacterium]
MRQHRAFGIDFEESELITSNDQFLTDGSGAFRSLDVALKHFDKLVRHDNVDDLSSPDPELIAECQSVGDNAS